VTDLDLPDRAEAVDPRGAFLRTVKEHLAPNINDHDLAYFGLAAQRLDLSPFTQPAQIVTIPRYDKRLKRYVHRPQITIDGRLTLAMRSGRIAAIGEGEWCGPSDTKAGRPPVWVGFWDDDSPPHGARSTIWLAGVDVPSRAVVRWKEFAQYDNEGALATMWAQMPAHMLHKVALALNLRRAVPDVLPKDLILYTEADEPPSDETPSGPPPLSAAGPEDAAPGSGPRSGAAPSPRRRSSWEEVPDDVYDNLPEAQGQTDRPYRYDPDDAVGAARRQAAEAAGPSVARHPAGAGRADPDPGRRFTE